MDPTKKRISPLLRTLIPATLFTLILLATLAACSDPTPVPTPVPTTTPTPATPTATPASTETPAANPTAAPTETPGDSPIPESTETLPPSGRLAPIRLQDSQSFQSALSEGETACIGDVPETLGRVLEWPSQGAKDEMLRLMGCLGDETLARLFLAGFIPGPEPLSLETSDCVRAVFAVIDPQVVKTAGIEDDPERAERVMAGSMAASTATTACLNDEEWERATPMTEMGPQERADLQCLMEALGGPGEMAEAMRAAEEGDFAGLVEAAAACGLDRGPAIDQGPANPPPTPTPKPTGTASEPATTLTTIVAEIPDHIPEYDWKHWTDGDGNCQDSRP